MICCHSTHSLLFRALRGSPGGSAAVCDPNPPRPFARSRFQGPKNPASPFALDKTRDLSVQESPFIYKGKHKENGDLFLIEKSLFQGKRDIGGTILTHK